MTSTRFTRFRGSRFVIIVVALILMCGLVIIFQSSQKQLNELRQQHSRCAQQQDTLNMRLQSVLEKKFRVENSLESERQEHRIARQELEKKVKEENENQYKFDLESNIRLDRLKQSLKFLQSEHSNLVEECSKSKKQQSEQINDLEKKVISLRSELQKEKNINLKEIAAWNEKYDIVVREKTNLEQVLKKIDIKGVRSKINTFKEIIKEYESKCSQITLSTWRDNGELLETNDILNSLNTAANLSHIAENPANQKASIEHFPVSLNVFKTPAKPSNKSQYTIYPGVTSAMVLESTKMNLLLPITDIKKKVAANKTVDLISFSPNGLLNNLAPLIVNSTPNNRSLIINSVENFQIVPKSAKSNFVMTNRNVGINSHPKYNVKISPLSSPFKHLTAENASTTKSVQENVGLYSNETNHGNNIDEKKLNSSKNESHQNLYKQLPFGVAPIPDNLDGMLKNDHINTSNKIINPKTEDNDNNRYANVFKDNRKIFKRDNLPEGDAAAGDVKEKEVNINHEDDFFNSNLIDNNKGNIDFENAYKKDEGSNENSKGQRNRLAENENLNNEVAGDQGKEFLDGLRLDDGNDEDEDEDDYSNPIDRQQEGLVIRN